MAVFGPEGRAANCGMWPTHGSRPGWWSNEWKADWPLETEPSAKRRASLALEQGDQPSAASTDGQANASVTKWVRLGPKGDHRHPAQRPTNLHHQNPWVLAPDAGVMGLAGLKRSKRKGVPRQDTGSI